MLIINIKDGHASVFQGGHNVVETHVSNLKLRYDAERVVLYTGINAISEDFRSGVVINGTTATSDNIGTLIGDYFPPVPGTPYVEAFAPEGDGMAYRVSDVHLTPAEGEAFFCLFPDDDAPTRDYVALEVNGVDCQLYWKGENIGHMARTLGHVFTRSNGYVHFVCTAPGRLELAGVDGINYNGRLYLTPSQYISHEWYAAD